MLKALHSQLKQLAADSDKTLEKRFYKETNYSQAKKHQAELKNFILCLPDLLQQIRIWLESDQSPSNLKKVYGYLLTYLYHSIDFLPEEDFGFWGYLDDAYFAGLVYQETLLYHPTIEQKLPQDVPHQVANWLQQTRQVIPQHTEKIDSLFQSVLKGDTEKFHDAIVS